MSSIATMAAHGLVLLPFPAALELWLGDRISQSATDLGTAKASPTILYT
jgi:hypothetical protein